MIFIGLLPCTPKAILFFTKSIALKQTGPAKSGQACAYH